MAKDLIKQYKEKQKTAPLPPFVNDFVKGRYQNQIWKWHWEWNSIDKFYYIVDLNIECPNCHQGILHLVYMNYRCAKCNADIPYGFIHGNPQGVMKQIIEDARANYSDYQGFIGWPPKTKAE